MKNIKEIWYQSLPEGLGSIMATFVWTVIMTMAITIREVLNPVKIMMLVIGGLLIGVGLYVVFAKQKGLIEPAQPYYRFGARTRRRAVIFIVVTTLATVLITSSWQRQELADLKREKLDHGQITVSEYTRIESEYKALLSSLSALADAYNKLSKDAVLAEVERDKYRKLYEDTKIELDKQKLYVQEATTRRLQAVAALEELKKSLGKTGTSFIAVYGEIAREKDHSSRQRFTSLNNTYRVDFNIKNTGSTEVLIDSIFCFLGNYYTDRSYYGRPLIIFPGASMYRGEWKTKIWRIAPDQSEDFKHERLSIDDIHTYNLREI